MATKEATTKPPRLKAAAYAPLAKIAAICATFQDPGTAAIMGALADGPLVEGEIGARVGIIKVPEGSPGVAVPDFDATIADLMAKKLVAKVKRTDPPVAKGQVCYDQTIKGRAAWQVLQGLA